LLTRTISNFRNEPTKPGCQPPQATKNIPQVTAINIDLKYFRAEKQRRRGKKDGGSKDPGRNLHRKVSGIATKKLVDFRAHQFIINVFLSVELLLFEE